jgi:excinuclease ABC subunit C
MEFNSLCDIFDLVYIFSMQFSSKINDKLKGLPDKPGVYFMRNRSGRVIYVGKASSLRNRVSHYFQPATFRSGDPKLRSLIRSIKDFDYLVTASEEDAALNESRLIKEYQPRYNVLAKDSKRFMMLKIDLKAPCPRFEFCRFKKNDGATYFGPYTSSTALRVTREFAEVEFGLRACKPLIPDASTYKHCNNDIIRYCSAPCVGKVSPREYRERAEEACAFLRGERPRYIKRLKQEMEKAAAERKYEQAAALRDTIQMIRRTIEQRIRAPKSLQVRADEAQAGLRELKQELGLERLPKVIECFDISNISGTLSVGSMVCAVDGRPRRNRYRHFRIKTVEGADDPRSMAEVVGRRIERALKEQKALPDLIVCDGGITQLRAALARLAAIPEVDIPVIGLAKKFEEIVRDIGGRQVILRLPHDSKALIVLQTLRDEAHRFAITYHRKLRNKRISESVLDDISGIGEKKKELLLKHFGSIHRLRKASLEGLSAAPGVGPKTAELIYRHLHREDEEA